MTSIFSLYYSKLISTNHTIDIYFYFFLDHYQLLISIFIFLLSYNKPLMLIYFYFSIFYFLILFSNLLFLLFFFLFFSFSTLPGNSGRVLPAWQTPLLLQAYAVPPVAHVAEVEALVVTARLASTQM